MARVVPNNSVIADSLKTTSLFKDHLLASKNQDYKFHYTHYDYLPFVILFISFIVFVWLYVSYFKRLNTTIKGFFINRFANQLAREEFSFGNRVTVFLSVLFVLTITLFFSQTFRYFGLGAESGSFTFLNFVIALAVLAIYLLKFITIKFTGIVFQAPKAASEYILTIFLFCNTLGLFLLPVVLCISFVRQISPLVFIYIGESIIALFILTRIIKGLIIWVNGLRASGFYLFLYLCTLEILPFVVMVKCVTLITK